MYDIKIKGQALAQVLSPIKIGQGATLRRNTSGNIECFNSRGKHEETGYIPKGTALRIENIYWNGEVDIEGIKESEIDEFETATTAFLYDVVSEDGRHHYKNVPSEFFYEKNTTCPHKSLKVLFGVLCTLVVLFAIGVLAGSYGTYHFIGTHADIPATRCMSAAIAAFVAALITAYAAFQTHGSLKISKTLWSKK